MFQRGTNKLRALFFTSPGKSVPFTPKASVHTPSYTLRGSSVLRPHVPVTPRHPRCHLRLRCTPELWLCGVNVPVDHCLMRGKYSPSEHSSPTSYHCRCLLLVSVSKKSWQGLIDLFADLTKICKQSWFPGPRLREPHDLFAIYLPFTGRENFLEEFHNIRVPGELGVIYCNRVLKPLTRTGNILSKHAR
jgi:hypothetical protein